MGFLTHFFVLSMFVLPVSGMRYKCHRDICDSSYQFCNDGEERCNICTPEQCQDDVAKHIFYQCELKCQELAATTTATSTESPTAFTAIVTTLDAAQESHFLTPTTGILIAGTGTILGFLFLVLWYVCRIDRKVSDLEKAENVSYSTISAGEDVEKTPLLEQPGIQVVQNDESESDSGAHLNKMEEIRTLAQAPAQAAAVVAQPDQADPPSYTTSDMTNKTPTMSSLSSVEAVQDSGLQNYFSEEIPETEFLQQNFKKEIEIEKDIGMENTRCKSVQHQSHMRY
ncbi:uncharacterized protein [Haliotis asinina]|uniref:uncharacterized protein n=1 Tax=Haliotis asinina TaxID=109174 RepID=UPI0035325D8A